MKSGTTPSLCAQVQINMHETGKAEDTQGRQYVVWLSWFWTQVLSSPLECHSSCKTCTGATNQDCDECKEGWEEDDQETCVGKSTKKKKSQRACEVSKTLSYVFIIPKPTKSTNFFLFFCLFYWLQCIVSKLAANVDRSQQKSFVICESMQFTIFLELNMKNWTEY